VPFRMRAILTLKKCDDMLLFVLANGQWTIFLTGIIPYTIFLNLDLPLIFRRILSTLDVRRAAAEAPRRRVARLAWGFYAGCTGREDVIDKAPGRGVLEPECPPRIPLRYASPAS
jgi:hypothetical protein